MKGKFFVIDGIDGSGKGTQTDLIVERLKNEGFNILKADFPRYGEKSASLVEEYLNGKFGKADEVSPYQASIFYACDRFAFSKEMKEHLEKGGIIISNRYVSSNQIHQASKIKEVSDFENFLEWLDNLEFEIFKIPKPDRVFFLNIPYEIADKLVEKKVEREYIKGDKKKDIHEEDEEYMKKSYEKSLLLLNKFNYWKEVKCVNSNDELRSIENINEEIYRKIKEEI